MKQLSLILFVFFFAAQAFGQNCPPNLDFENGDYSFWEYSKGSVSSVNGKNQIVLTPCSPIPGRHELISSANAGMDFYGNFPTLCPYGGDYSFKLGNMSTGSEAEGLSYTFTVPSAVDTFTFTFFYAVVFQDPQHNHDEQPRFFATAYDVLTGNLINCASYDFVATGSIPGFRVSTKDPSVLYKNWSPVSIQFAGLANRQVRLEFKTADCTRGGHFGYAYVDVGTGCSNILATAPYCVETNSVLLNAPFGFSTYTWYNHDYSQVLGNQQSLTLSPPPAVNDIFYVDMVPYPGFGCRDTTYAIVHPEPVPDTPVANSFYRYCQYDGAPPLSAKANSGYDLLWYLANSGGSPSGIEPIPSTSVAGTFTFYVSQKKLFGCESLRKKITVVVSPTPTAAFTVNTLNQCENDNHFILTNKSTNLENTTYNWDFGDGKTQSDTNAVHTYLSAGNFAIKLKAVNSGVCFNEKLITVKVIPKPNAAFTYPAIICEKQTTINLVDKSAVPQGVSIINNWWWDINGTSQNLQVPAVIPFVANTAGPMPVKLVVTTRDGCRSDTTIHILPVHYQPVVAFTYALPLCNNEAMQFTNLSSMPPGSSPEIIGRWDWQFDNGGSSSGQHPYQSFIPGLHHTKLVAESNFGCRSLVADSVFTVHAKPSIDLDINDSCVAVPIHYTAMDLTNTVVSWYWNFGNGLYQGTPQVTKVYYNPGSYPFTLIGQTIDGCRDTVFRPFTIFDNRSFAGRDITAAMGQPVQLDANGGAHIQYTWSPGIGLDDPNIENPVATYDKDQAYHLYSVSDKGCVSQGNILIKRYKGPALFMPTAFTPNGDGKNDVFRVIPAGIKQFISLEIYNRNGEMIFYSADPSKGWDGTLRGIQMASQNFVAVARAIDYRGVPMLEKGNLMLIR